MESGQIRDKFYLTYLSTSSWFLLLFLCTKVQSICQENSVISATANISLLQRGEGRRQPWLTQDTQLNHPTGLNPQTSAQSLHKRVSFFIPHPGVHYKALSKGKMIQLQVAVDQKVFKLQQELEDYQYSQTCVTHSVTVRTYYEGQ